MQFSNYKKFSRNVRAVSFVLLWTLFITSCPQPFSLKELVDGPDGKALTVSPTSARLQINDTLPIDASGGIPPYSFSVVSGSGVFAGNTYTAPPSPGTETIRVTDKAGVSREALITVENATGLSLGITPASGTVFTGGTIDFDPIGGTGPFTFALAGASGGSVDASGLYTAGSNPGADAVTITDTSDSSTDTAAITVAAKPLSISPETITVYVNQPVTFTAVGGDGGFSYALGANGSGAPPMVGGVYTAGPNPGTDTVVMTDAYDLRQRTATITVVNIATNVDYAATAITNIVPVDVLTGSGFNAEFSIDNNGGANGSKTIYWTVYASADTTIGGADDRIAASGSLAGKPAGSTTPVLFGGTWPSDAGAYYLLAEVSAADDLDPSDNRNQSAGTTQIYEPVRISPAVAAVSTGGTVDFTVSGGTGSYSYTITAGSGAPSMAGDTYTAGAAAGTDIVEVRNDGYPAWPAATATITVGAKTLAVSPETITVYVNQQVTFGGIGGTGPFSYAITANGSGAAMAGAVYTAGPNPGTDTVTLTDTSDGRTRPATVTVVDTATNVDYAAGAVVGIVSADVLTGSGFNAEFSIDNNGGANGSKTIYWTVYASADITIGGADDRIAASGSLAGKPAGSTTPVPFGGVWPSDAGAYYLLAEVSAADDLDPSDNRNRSAGTTQIYEPVRISPAVAAVSTGGTVDFTVSGGTGSYSYTITTAGSGAPSMTGDTYTAGAAAGTDIVEVRNVGYPAWPAATATITVGAKTLAVSPETITVYVNQQVTFGGIGGTGPFSYAITANGSGASMAGAVYTAGPNPGTDTVTLTDTSDGRTRPATVTVVDTATNVDYAATVITNIVPVDVLTGSGFNAEFSIVNNGSANGSKTIYWTVYTSTDITIGGADDRIAASGSLAGKPFGSTTPVPFGGVWPSDAGAYYLLVEVSAADDLDPSDNRNRSAGTTQIYRPLAISPVLASVYTGQAVGFTASGGTGSYQFSLTTNDSGGSVTAAGGAYTAGPAAGTDIVEVSDTLHPLWTKAAAAIIVALVPPPPGGDVEYTVSSFTAVDTTPDAGSPIGESFTLRNSGADAGSSSLNWAVYLSQNTTLGNTVGDVTLLSSSRAALAGDDTLPGGADEAVTAVVGSWPASAGTWYLKVVEWADDEATPNEWFVSGPFTVQPVSVDVDYYVSTPPAGGIGVSLNDPVSASFVVTNLGADGGTASVSWYAYISTDTAYNAGDTLVDAGSFAALPSGANSGAVPINSGIWSEVGNRYLLVRLQASDETYTVNNVRASAAAYAVTDPVASAPDYIVGAISRVFPIATADSAVSETFTITNMGSAGAAAVSWTAYASTDAALGGDTVIGSGTIAGGLPAGASASGIAINGFWPNLAANFYIIIQVDAADETNHNDVGVSADSFNIKLPPDYLITGTVFTAISNGGNVNETLQSAGGGVRPGFRIRENGGQNGLQTITWRVFKSADQSLGGDTQVAFGTIPALLAGQTSTLIEFNDTLPAVRGMHYYIIQVSSPDDRDLTNNVMVSPAMYCWSDGDSADGTTDGADGSNSETDITESDTYLNMAEDYSVKLNPGDSVKINALIDEFDSYDLFLFRTGTGVTSLQFTVTWATGTDDLDFSVLNQSGAGIDSSIAKVANSEPASPPLVVPVSANSTYYIFIRAWLAGDTNPAKTNSPGEPYTLRVTAP